ncbi:hypothetical protein [Leptospira sp. 'Mane']|uniref:hypothetical protein n=1 Tax=Leptospira sp. 'Mane' TaxID=3387407 RepID=UPI00398A9858
MADQEKNKNEDLENLDPILDEDTFSLDLDDFDLGDDDLDSSPGMEPPGLDDIEHNDAQLAASHFEDDEDGLGDLIVSTSDDSDEDLLDIDLDSDLNLLGEEDPILHDEDIHSDFEDYEVEETPSHKTPNDALDDELELEFDDDIIDLDKEIDAILNGEDGILSGRKDSETEDFESDFNVDEEEDGPIALSMEELENIAGLSEEEEVEEYGIGSEDDFEISSVPDEEDSDDFHTGLDLDLDDSEVDTKLTFNEEGLPELNLDDETEPAEPADFKPIRDPEEEELFGSAKEDENLTLSDDELGNILGSNGEASLEETLGSEEDFAEAESIPGFGDDEFSFEPAEDLEEESTSLEDEDSSNTDFADDEDDDGPITLSLEELDHISEEAEEEETTLDILDDEPEDETITLSPDELGNILGDEESEEEEESSEDSTFDIDLGSDELPEMSLDSDEEESESSSGLEGEYEETQNDILSDDPEEDDGPIALSLEELESIAGDAEEAPDEELVDSLDRAPLPYEEEQAAEDAFLEEDLEDESIALSMEELENITADEEDAEVETLSNENIDDLLGEVPGDGLDDIGELPEEESLAGLAPSPEEDSEEDHEIELTLDPLDLPADDSLVSFEDEETAESVAPVIENLVPTLAGDASAGIEIDLDDYALEGKLSPLEELRAETAPPELAASQSKEDKEILGSELSVVERKKVLGYLDNLLGNLPDEVIKEFSKSDYFDLYKKLMKELEL